MLGAGGRRGVAGDAANRPGRTFKAAGSDSGDAERRESPEMPRIARGALLRPWATFRGDAERRGSLGMPRIARGALLRPWGAIWGNAQRRLSPGMPQVARRRSKTAERLPATRSRIEAALFLQVSPACALYSCTLRSLFLLGRCLLFDCEVQCFSTCVRLL